jgi:hypothetical protein
MNPINVDSSPCDLLHGPIERSGAHKPSVTQVMRLEAKFIDAFSVAAMGAWVR